MSKTLYRKYRPQNFSEIIGQDHIKLTIQNEINNDNIAHAYLFSGPRGIGKTTMARVFAKAINCEKLKGFEPCNECEICKSITKGNNLDLIEIDAASNRGINEIRELRERVKYAPSRGKYKVFIIDEVHMLTVEAFNALLKTLEEPPQHAIFILATTELHKLPATVISRCQKFDFKAVDINKLKNHLLNVCTKENIKVDQEIVERISRYSGVYVRDALSTLGQILSLSENNEVKKEVASLILPESDYEPILNLIDNILYQKFDMAIRTLDKLVGDGVDLKFFTEELINYIRKIILVKLAGASEKFLWDVSKNVEEKIMEQSQKLDLKIWHGILKEFYSSFDNIKNDAFKQLPLEMAIIAIKNDFFDAETIYDESFPQKEKKIKEKQIVKNKEETIQKKKTIFLKEVDKDESSIQNEKKPNINTSINAKIEDVTKIWPQLLLNLKDYNHSLSAFVKSGHPLNIENDKLIIGFKFKFHADRIINYKQNVEDVLSGILNEKIIVNIIVDEDYEKNHAQILDNVYTNNKKKLDNDSVGSLIESFGGEVVG
ncbi:DNA polymerase III subunit gamma/tau [bacterium]|nr:DNA polymerase III subunit gamma/tau [bacterium]